jgi:para-aminobenzoate synthetase / 4-amino-4-deoxychorismate lyase
MAKDPRRPNPALGVFETLLVVAGQPIDLDTHMGRLGASLGALGAALPDGTGDLVRERAAALPLGRVRLTVAPVGGNLACDVVTAAIGPEILFPIRERGAELFSLSFAGGLGCHKWVDRSMLPGATGAGVPLLLDHGEVLEADRANVFVARGGLLATPPADGRILPGIARAATIEVAREEGIDVLERRLDRQDLLDAEEVFLTGSVRGTEPVRSLDGVSLGASGELSQRVGGALRRRWQSDLGAAASPTYGKHTPALPRPLPPNRPPRAGRRG